MVLQKGHGVYLSVPFEDGEVFVVELSDEQGSGVIRASRGDELFETSADTFESGMARVQRVAATMLERLADLPRSPDHVRAEFGLRVTAEAGLVVAKGSGDAHIKLELEWSRPEGGR
ncbi:CU044_2847 family protein [Streptomyces marokkonensis]|uniref:CU044_2847 family protein n=1 Tax=Streptomyces marokkonensis TaxID=324855 RepID=UPI001FCC2D47|nr:CU044_2847 family protein [Streptomyces marokkonensis]